VSKAEGGGRKGLRERKEKKRKEKKRKEKKRKKQ